MEVPTFIPDYGQRTQSNRKDPEGVRIRIRHDILNAAEGQRPKGMSVKAYLNQRLAEVLLADFRQ
jgi:hypothetical protein